MRNLPSVQKWNVEIAKQEFLKEGHLEINEPCDCAGQIRHYNGGNYHEEIVLAKDCGKVFVKYGSSSEYDDSEWEECDDWERVVEEHRDWL
jgi:hypothetical protein